MAQNERKIFFHQNIKVFAIGSTQQEKNGIRKDRYFIIRYKLDGKNKSEGFGWESEGYTELKAFEAVCAIKQNIKKWYRIQKFKRKI